ncbi:hypothetical protein L1987_62226 [Smallanthus sonchifolius]|uniref:Uncharacterized protein n=1 Tax=Smallanthus sonchifolius TaxID=185202 RepID=A0ACB9CA25_9ASTR|nr:hypothetical protein L1987_62226 [Smallanthus sonchifolius]
MMKANSMEDMMMKDEERIDIPNTSNGSPPSLFGNREDYLNLAVPLYKASIMGDWETAKIIFDKHPDLVRFGLSKNFGTALHVVATAEETEFTLNFVKNLVNMMTREELELKNNNSNTAFWVASAWGKMKMAKIMMEKNPSLLDIRGNGKYFPLTISAMNGVYNMVKCLYKNSQKMAGNHWTDKDRSLTLSHCVKSNFFDVALQILEDHPELAQNVSLLEVLAQKPYAFRTVEKNTIMRIITRTVRFFYMKVQPAAGEDTEPLKLLKTIWGHATRTMNLDEIENMLKVGKSSKKMAAKASGASLLMQRELLWFKEVEKMVPPYMKEAKNKDDQTPYELFSKENEDLVSKGLKWMKDCMVVATLIVTVAFAVAFTVPGGYNQDHGLPVFINQRSFLIFVIADAISLFSSSTSLLVFLSIVTSHPDQHDFMYSLPGKLMIGLLTLFISVATMMVTFSSSFFVLYHKGLQWVPILISTSASLPVLVFAVLQLPLWVDMFRSMFDSHYLFKPKKPMLYTTKPRLHSNNSRFGWFSYKSITTRIFFKRC